MKITYVTHHKNDPGMLDITEPQLIELKVSEDGRVAWVNVDGVRRLRACRIHRVIVEDNRPHDNTEESQSGE